MHNSSRADDTFKLVDAAKTALSRQNSQAIAYLGQWRDGSWIAAVAGQFDRYLGDALTVGLVARNRPRHVVLCLANLAAQRTTVMINCAQTPTGLAAEISRLALPVIVADRDDWSEAALAAASAVGTAAIATDDAAGDGAMELLHAGDGRNRPANGDPPALQLLSSGTTGPPKLVDLSWKSVSSSIENASTAYAGSGSPAPQIMVHPLGNVAGLAYALPPLIFNRPLVLLDRFSVVGWAEAVRDYRPSRGTLPPAGVTMMLDSDIPADWLSSLELVAVGGGKVPNAQVAEFERRFNLPLLTAYGATEFAGVIANWSLEEYRRVGKQKLGSAGRASAGVVMRIVDADSGAELKHDQVGLLEAKVARLGDAWIRTTDLASMDEDGFLFIEGRADGAINRGGFKVVPEYVAGKLRELPGVADAAVIGIADTRLGEVPVAAVEAKANAELVPADLIAALRDSLPAYQVPVEIRIVDALPRNASFKIALIEVRKLFERS